MEITDLSSELSGDTTAAHLRGGVLPNLCPYRCPAWRGSTYGCVKFDAGGIEGICGSLSTSSWSSATSVLEANFTNNGIVPE